MRIELAGSINNPGPLVLFLTNGVPFAPQQYLDLGYRYFDLICIGAGGGCGGGINTVNTGTLVRSHGGAGGGGGLQRVKGLLSALPASCPVVVGTGGAPGLEHDSDPTQTTNGSDGGASSFNTNTCRASGGKGGRRVQSNSDTVTTQAHGGQGGAGGTVVAGGGSAGGTAGTPTAVGPGVAGTPGVDGTWDGSVGTGGGGGAGGVAKYGGTTCNPATAGGNGSYNPGDTSVYGPGEPPSVDGSTGALNATSGGAGGAQAAPVNGLSTVYGMSNGHDAAGYPGAVIIRLVTP